MRCRPRNFENLTFIARRREQFWDFLAIFLVVQLPPKRGFLSTQEFTRFLSTVSSQRRAMRSDVSFQTKQSECLATVDLTLYTYRPQSEVLCDLYLKRVDLTKGLLFDTFSITVWYKFCRYDHSVLELEMIPTRCCRSRNHFQKIWPAAHFFHIFFA